MRAMLAPSGEAGVAPFGFYGLGVLRLTPPA